MRGSIIHNGEFFSLRELLSVRWSPPLCSEQIYMCALQHHIYWEEDKKDSPNQHHQKDRKREKKNGQRCRIDNTKREVLRALWFIRKSRAKCSRDLRMPPTMTKWAFPTVCVSLRQEQSRHGGKKLICPSLDNVYYYFNKDVNKVKR